MRMASPLLVAGPCVGRPTGRRGEGGRWPASPRQRRAGWRRRKFVRTGVESKAPNTGISHEGPATALEKRPHGIQAPG